MNKTQFVDILKNLCGQLNAQRKRELPKWWESRFFYEDLDKGGKGQIARFYLMQGQTYDKAKQGRNLSLVVTSVNGEVELLITFCKPDEAKKALPYYEQMFFDPESQQEEVVTAMYDFFLYAQTPQERQEFYKLPL